MMEKILILGSGGHAHSVVDSIEAMGGYEIAGFVAASKDDRVTYRGYGVIGVDNDLPKLYEQGIRNACVGIGYLGRGNVRERLYGQLKDIGYTLPNIIDPSATLASDVKLGEGCFIGKMAVLNSGCILGDMVIVNSGAVVEHDCKIGDFTHIAVNAAVCGGACVGQASLVGAGAVVLQEVIVGSKVIVAANSTVRKDTGDLVMVIGNKVVKSIGGLEGGIELKRKKYAFPFPLITGMGAA